MPKKLNSVILNVILLVMGVITVYPFIWMILSSFKQNQEIMALDQKLLPEQFTIQNYINMNERVDFMRFFFPYRAIFLSEDWRKQVGHTSCNQRLIRDLVIFYLVSLQVLFGLYGIFLFFSYREQHMKKDLSILGCLPYSV